MPASGKSIDVKCIADVHNNLGESPVWDAREQALYWVDIPEGLVQRWDYRSRGISTWKLQDRVATVALRERGGFLAAMASEVVLFELGGELKSIANPEIGLPENRSNDGKCDARGRFWFGTMHDSATQTNGSLYRCDLDGSCHCVVSDLGIPNGISWSPDSKKMYLADSFVKTIFDYDFDLESGTIANRRIFRRLLDDSEAVPDGSTVDAEGYLWSAEWNGWRVVRYTPHGEVDRVVDVPVQRPTSCTIGGPNMDQLFITSAIWDLKEQDLKVQPQAGGVFVVDARVRGLECARYKG